MAVSGKIRNYIFIAVLSIAIISAVIGVSVANGQNKVYKDNYIRYQQATTLMGQGKYAEASRLLNGLDQNFEGSAEVQYKLGLCSAAMGNFNEAVSYMQKAQQIKPALLQDQSYLTEFGRILYLQGDYKLAKLYLLESKKYNRSPQLTERANYILQLMEDK